ncbi:MAG: transglycosylase SLT domain-containing protein [Paracoccaceae bacterium]
MAMTFSGLLEALIQHESKGDPTAISKKGAVGLTQVRPQFAHDLGYDTPSVFDVARKYGYDTGGETVQDATELLKVPEISTELGGEYLRNLIKKYGGDLNAALTAYNMGPKSYNEFAASGGDRSRLGVQARDYPSNVAAEYLEATGEQMPMTIKLDPRLRPRARPEGVQINEETSLRPRARPAGLLGAMR